MTENEVSLNREEMKKQVTHLTCDVWDTLIRRDCHPEAIKFQTARRAHYWLQESSVGKSISISELYFTRIAIERKLGQRKLRDGLDEEYDIREVLRELLVRKVSLPISLVITYVDALVEEEIKCEIFHTYPDPTIEKIICKVGAGTIAFISDFYMPADVLVRVLFANGIDCSNIVGFSSCEQNLNKRSGRLYELVREKLGAKYESWLHIGDNQYSDCIVPSKLGINVVHHWDEREEDKKKLAALQFNNKREWLDSTLDLVGKEYKFGNRGLFFAGVRLGPLFAGFCEKILARHAATPFDKVVFITREGGFLKRLFDTYLINTDLSVLTSTIRTEWFETSRYALLNSQSHSLQKFAPIWRQYGLRGVRRFLIQQGVGGHDADKLLKLYGLGEEEVIENPLDDLRVQNLLNDNCFKASNGVFVKRNKELLTRYADRIFGVESQKILLIDVGWFGTCQDILTSVFPKLDFSGLYLGLRRTVGNPDNKEGFIFDGTVASESVELTRFGEVFEVITASLSPPVIGYRIDAKGIAVPETDALDLFSETDERVVELQAGIHSSVEGIASRLRYSRMELDDLREFGISFCLDTLRNPPQALSALYFDSDRHDKFREQDLSSRRDVPSIYNHLEAIFFKDVRERVIFFYRSVQWLEGFSYEAEKMSFIKRWWHIGVFKLARMFRKNKRR